jgi:hypothetical protein
MQATNFSTEIFGPRVERNRNRFRKALQSERKSVRNRASLIFENPRKTDGRYSIGELVPVILGDISRVSAKNDGDLIEAWYYVYAATIMIDDLADGDLRFDATTLLDTIALVHKATAKILLACKNADTKQKVLVVETLAHLGEKSTYKKMECLLHLHFFIARDPIRKMIPL